ncbi:MAG: C40 family peptidase [Lachnospiraceae bacterium]|nr:C40 family peptidase [Lachnospiraceae bacterium]
MSRRKQILSLLLAGVMMTSLVNPATAYASGAESSVADVGNSEQTAVSYHTTTPSASSAVTIDADETGASEGDGSSGQNSGGGDSISAPSGEGNSGGAGSGASEEDTKSEEGSAADDPGTSSSDGPADSAVDADSSTATDPGSSVTTDTDSSAATDTDSSGIPDESGLAGPGESDVSVPDDPGATDSDITKTSYTLSIIYKYENGKSASSTYSGNYKAGESYSIKSPTIKGYKASHAAVTGKMGASDKTVTVTYTAVAATKAADKEFTLTISYVRQGGGRIADTYVGTLKKGAAYNVASPSVAGYKPDKSSVSGTITADTNITVTYTPIAQVVPAPTRSYTVRTPSQAFAKIVNPELAGFTKIAKAYAYADVNYFLNIREGKGKNNEIVGVLYSKNLCFVIDDSDPEWVYIESGTVRGFVQREYLVTGEEAEEYVNSHGGESAMKLAKQLIAPANNKAFRYTMTTVRDIPTTYNYISATASADRQAMISYARQFLGNPYVWGGESLTEGTDCSGFTQQIYAAFGISLPRCSYEQAEAGTKIAVEDALPGDLVFYARDGVVYHVMMYIGNGQVIHASSSTTGIIESNLNYDKVCWACRFITDDSTSSTQASALVAIGKKAVEGDTGAQMQIIESLATAATRAYEQYGLLRSVMIAQAIQESGWLSFSSQTNGGIQPSDNNILNISEDVGDDTWLSPWTGIAALRSMPVSDGFQTVYEDVSVRTYEDMEACLADEAAYLVGTNLTLKGEKNVDTVIDTALKDYTDDPGYRQAIKDIIEKYSLTRYDSIAITGTSAKDDSSYTKEELELIWAIVAQEDDQSYEGALAVISSAMNRADANYGGYGTTALAQLTADGQYCYSPKVSDPSLWQRRLGGNVPDDVKKAVEDCLTKGIRNNTYLNFRSSNRTGDYIQIGANWYF